MITIESIVFEEPKKDCACLEYAQLKESLKKLQKLQDSTLQDIAILVDAIKDLKGQVKRLNAQNALLKEQNRILNELLDNERSVVR